MHGWVRLSVASVMELEAGPMGFGFAARWHPEGKRVEQHPLQRPRSPRRRVRLWRKAWPRFAPAQLSARGAQPGERVPTSVDLEDAWLQYFLRRCTGVPWCFRRPGGADAWQCRFHAPLVDRTSVFDRTARGPSNEPLHPPNTLLTALACSARCTGWHGRGSRLGSTNRARRALS